MINKIDVKVRVISDVVTIESWRTQATLATWRTEIGGGRHRRLHSATPEYELDAFEFFNIILENSSRRQRLPDTFMKMMEDHRPKNMKLRQAGSGLRRH